jgi:hypothetical protein
MTKEHNPSYVIYRIDILEDREIKNIRLVHDTCILSNLEKIPKYAKFPGQKCLTVLKLIFPSFLKVE